jgi:hypothetical protein
LLRTSAFLLRTRRRRHAPDASSIADTLGKAHDAWHAQPATAHDPFGFAPGDRAQRFFPRRKHLHPRSKDSIVAMQTSIQRMNARISTSHPINNNKRMLRWHYDAMS